MECDRAERKRKTFNVESVREKRDEGNVRGRGREAGETHNIATNHRRQRQLGRRGNKAATSSFIEALS